MNAHQFVQTYGISSAKELRGNTANALLDMREYRLHVDDIDQAIADFELLEQFDDLNGLKDALRICREMREGKGRFYGGVFEKSQRELSYEQAIQRIEENLGNTSPVGSGEDCIKERPILLKNWEVNAILEGRKTQLRRVIKSQPVLIADAGKHSTYAYRGGLYALDMYKDNSNILEKCLYGQTGTHLWVRESWSTHACFDDVPTQNLESPSIHYWADGPCQTGRKRPPILMPRWASRILLEITNVRIERLNDISEADAIAEGIEADDEYCAEENFSMQWNISNGWSWKGWNANPWVWVIDFRVVEGGES